MALTNLEAIYGSLGKGADHHTLASQTVVLQ